MFGVNVSGDKFVGVMPRACLLLVGRMQQCRCSGGCLGDSRGHGLGVERGENKWRKEG